MRRTGLAALSALAALLGLELVARVRWTKPWYDRMVEAQSSSASIRYTENRFGLRDRDYPSPKPADRLRLLILGDSFTHGYGVAEDELVFPELLERELDRLDWPGKSGVDVLNGGLPASLTQHWLRLWKEVADDFDPDALLIVFFLRDGTRLHTAGFFDEVYRSRGQASQASALYRHCYLYRTLRDAQVRRRILRDYHGGFDEAYFGSDEQTKPWQRAQRRLLELRDQALARGVTVGFAVFPILVELNDDYPFQAVVDLLVAFGRDSGMPTHDLLPAFLGQDATELWVSPEDQHPNARGHAIAARSLLPFAERLLRDALVQSTR